MRLVGARRDACSTSSCRRWPTHGFRFEAAEVARALAAGRLETWSMPWAATRRVMAAMDEVRRQVGVVYPGEAA